MTDHKRALLNRAIETYGRDNQILKAFEELGELMQAVAKHMTDKEDTEHLAEEIADVRIMLDQLCMIWDVESRARAWEYYKLGRLKERLDRRGEGADTAGGDGDGT